ncbi:MAG: hypothetical protein KatS3mg015_3250 [Fimbriimonadales bacterium]|nr:MAG: hypothetical protein KatS3mg015_2833 [Fimbriimonadales bacterium]GIV04420.1 MAG: hypothetical protein KatS3mg015_3250 [Fimbriimonadales bacterium]
MTPVRQKLVDLLHEYLAQGNATVAEREMVRSLASASRRLAEAVRPLAQGHEECTPASDEEPFGCERVEMALALRELDGLLQKMERRSR